MSSKNHLARTLATSFFLVILAVAAPAVAADDKSSNPPTSDRKIIPPEIVQLEGLHFEGDTKIIDMVNPNLDSHYLLYCNTKAEGCVSPQPNKNYFLFDKDTYWKMPSATKFINLEFIQGWTVKYEQGENIGLVAEAKDAPDVFGMYLKQTNGDYQYQDTVAQDGPVIYGAGLSDADRKEAWQHFFMQMVEACGHQQGTDVLGLKLKRRCNPKADFCTTMIDAKLVGIGGIEEPRKVSVMVMTDPKDLQKQLWRVVCTWPSADVKVCRDWDTGKLIDDTALTASAAPKQ